MLERITHLDQFRAYFTNWRQSWYFAKPDDTDKLLKAIYSYSRFIKTVVAKSYLERLSSDNGDKLKTSFLELFLNEVEKQINKPKTQWFLDFVRLNIVAHRP